MNKKTRLLIIYATLFSIFGNLIWAAFYYFTDDTESKDYFLQEYASWHIIPRFVIFFLIGYLIAYRDWRRKHK